MQARTPEDNSFFPREKELPRAGLEPATFCILGRPLYQLSHRGSSAGQAESLKFVQGKWRLFPDIHVHVHVHSHVQSNVKSTDGGGERERLHLSFSQSWARLVSLGLMQRM